MGKQQIFEETDYLIDLLDFYKIYENPEEHEEMIDRILDRILYMRELLEMFD